MGKRAVLYFETAQRLGGVRAKVALAVAAKLPSTEAAAAADTPELLDRLETGLREIKQRYGLGSTGGGGSGPSPHLTPAGGVPVVPLEGATLVGSTVEEKLRDHQRVLMELMTQRGLVLSTPETAARRVTEVVAHTLHVERVSVWRYETTPKIECIDLYQRHTHAHSSGVVLSGELYRPYFAALATEQTIAAHDARTDHRTSCFSESYLVPLGIASMLDVPVWVMGTMVGVLCIEHVGEPRHWSHDEETFAYLLGAVVGLALERAQLKPREITG